MQTILFLYQISLKSLTVGKYFISKTPALKIVSSIIAFVNILVMY